MPADVRSRWRVALCGGAAIFVTIGAVCLLVDGPSVALPAFSSYEKARDSAQCQACLGRIQNLHDTERDALSAEVGTCKRIEKNCEDRCPVDSKECEQNCKLDQYKCTHDAADHHSEHLGMSGRAADRHECHQPCSGISNECQACIDDMHAQRTANRAALEADTAKCEAQLEGCYSACEKNDKRCKLACNGESHKCREAAKVADRGHLGIKAMVDDHHHCKAVCEVSRSGLRL